MANGLLNTLFGKWLAPSIYDPIEVINQNKKQLVLQRGSVQILFDAERRGVYMQRRCVTAFDKIQAVEVRPTADEDDLDIWLLRLRLGWFSSIEIGNAAEEVDASIIAAQISTITGAPVNAWR